MLLEFKKAHFKSKIKLKLVSSCNKFEKYSNSTSNKKIVDPKCKHTIEIYYKIFNNFKYNQNF